MNLSKRVNPVIAVLFIVQLVICFFATIRTIFVHSLHAISDGIGAFVCEHFHARYRGWPNGSHQVCFKCSRVHQFEWGSPESKVRRVE
jgi:hypothetical protein